MKLKPISFLSIFAVGAMLGLSGCSGFAGTSVPDVQPQTLLGTIQGSVFGGHAPVVGAHLYVLQTSSSGYGTAVTSLLHSGSTANGFSTTADVNDPSIPTTGTGTPWYYETTDTTGAFNITGDYTCTAGSPVYLYAYGGSPTFPSNSNTFALTNGGTSVTQTGTNGGTFTYTTATTQNFYVGEQVTVSGYTGLYTFYNQTGSVLAAGLNTNKFEIQVPTYIGLSAGDPGQTTGSVTAVPTFNPAIVNLATLGICPSSGNFSTGGTNVYGTFTPIKYVYMNEVSTMATAAAFAGFATDALHIGTSSTNALGIENAARNASLLYDIQGSDVSQTYAGEGHVARPTTPGSVSGATGTVDQAKLDTLGNILAACVDSQNTYNSVSNSGTKSTPCTTLFNTATTTGTVGTGTIPIDIATAAFNIIKNPGTTGVVGLYTLPSPDVPFTPQLTAAPNDFTVGITFTAPGINGPQGIALDGQGGVWITNFFPFDDASPDLVKLNGDGTPGPNQPYAVPNARTAAVDLTSTYVYVTSQSETTISRVPVGGPTTGNPITTTNFGAGNDTFGIAVDANGNVDVTSYNNAKAYRFNTTSGGLTTFTGCGQIEPYITLDSSGNLWLDGTYQSPYVCELSSTGTLKTLDAAVPTANPFAIDATGKAWVPSLSSTQVGSASAATTSNGVYGFVTAITSGTTPTNFTSAQTQVGRVSGPSAIAIDGVGNIWIGNYRNSSISELTSTGAAVTSNVAYRSGTTNNQANIAIDFSGDLWLGYNGTSSGNVTVVTEVIGAAAPVKIPLSAATAVTAGGVGSLGNRP